VRRRWIGRRTVRPAEHAEPWHVQPIEVAAHAFGPGAPARELQNGTTIRQVNVAEIVCWHVGLDTHDVIVAEGLACEGYLGFDDHADFEDGPVMALHPRFAASDVGGKSPCAAFVRQGVLIELIRAKLARGMARDSAAAAPRVRPRDALAVAIAA
jgi:hypothetical protein